MSQRSLVATTRGLRLPAALVAALVAACTGKSETPAAGSSATPATTEAAAGAASAGGAANADSASSSVVTQSVPPTPQDRRVAVPDSTNSADTNHSGMAVTNRGAPKGSH
jgi:long-subunit fatty acid transport protein